MGCRVGCAGCGPDCSCACGGELHGADRGRQLAPGAQRLTEGRGAALEAHLEEGGSPGPAGRPEVNSGAGTATAGVWAAALDAARVRLDDGWHDVKAGVVFWAEPRWEGRELAGRKATAQSYVAEAGPMEEAGERLYREAVRLGIDPAADLVVCLGDGELANWNQFGLHFPRRVEALDWYHAVEHLWAGARERWGEDSAQVAAGVAARKEALWPGEVAAALTATSRPTCAGCVMLNSVRGYPWAAARWRAPASG